MLSIKAFIKGLLVQEETDRTKELSVEVDSGATTGTRTTLKSSQTANRTVNLPDADDTLMGRATTDNVSNKTLDNSNSATFVDNSLTIQGDGDATKQAQFNADTISTSTTRTLSLPDGDTELLGNDTAQVVENKTIDGTDATGNNTISADADDITFDNAGSGLTATDVQAAIDEVDSTVDAIGTNKLDGPGTHADNVLVKTDGVNTNDSQVTGISVDDSNNVTGVNDLTVGGDLTVNGTTTTLNTATLDVEDTNITVNKNGTDPSSEGAGITVERAGTDGSFVYEDALTSKFKLGALGSEVEVADVSSAQALTNKDLSDSSNNVDTASSDSFTRNTGNQQVVTIPDTASPDNFVLEDYVQAITNKDIDGGTASNTNRITIPKDTKANLDALTRKEGTVVYATDLDKFFGDDGTELFEIGSGGESGKNYFSGGNFEINADLATTYDDGGSFVDGTGGSPTALSVALNGTTPLAGESDLQVSKAASDAAGEGVTLLSDSIDRVDQGKELYFSADIDASDANYTSGDIEIKAYDVTNATILTVVPVTNLNSSNGIYNSQSRVIAKILCADDTAQVRISLHYETDSNTGSASSIYVDDAKLSPNVALIGSIIGEWTEYIPTGSWSAYGTYRGSYRRVGDSMEIDAVWKFVTTPSGSLTIDLPSGYSINLGKLSDDGGASSDLSTLGVAWAVDAGANVQYPLQPAVSGGSSIQFFDEAATGTNATSPFTWATNDGMSMRITVPINEWSAGNLLSANDASYQSVQFQGVKSTAQSLTADSTDINMNVTNKDTHGAWDGDSFTAPAKGSYQVDGFLRFDTSAQRAINLYVNTSSVKTIGRNSASDSLIQFSGQIDLEEGDVLTVRCDTTSDITAGIIANNHLSITQVPDLNIFGVYGETEYREVTAASTTSSSTADTWVDVTGLSLDLSPGEWEIGYNCVGYFAYASGSGHLAAGNFAIFDASNNLVTPSMSLMYNRMDTAADELAAMANHSTTITVTNPTTYKIRLRCSIASSAVVFRTLGPTGFLGSLTDPENHSTFWARRIK